jgi:hypothetical protein
VLVRVWLGADRTEERRLKGGYGNPNHPRRCPLCRPAYLRRQAERQRRRRAAA